MLMCGCGRLCRRAHATPPNSVAPVAARRQAELPVPRSQDAAKFMRHAKRSTLTTEDVNDALRLRNVQVRLLRLAADRSTRTAKRTRASKQAGTALTEWPIVKCFIAISHRHSASVTQGRARAAAVRLCEQGPRALPARGWPRRPLLHPGPRAQHRPGAPAPQGQPVTPALLRWPPAELGHAGLSSRHPSPVGTRAAGCALGARQMARRARPVRACGVPGAPEDAR
jgi:hypothetical protein